MFSNVIKDLQLSLLTSISAASVEQSNSSLRFEKMKYAQLYGRGQIQYIDVTVPAKKMENYKPGQNIWNKTEKSSKIGQEKKGLISISA